MQKFNGQLINQFPNSINGNAAAGAQVTVRLKSSGVLANLYAVDSISGATLSNPLTADQKGYYGFYAPDGVYTLDVSISGTPQLEIQLQDVAALQAQFDGALANAGYIPVGTFAIGCTVSQSNGVVSDGSAYWRWDGALPKTVTPGSSPLPVGASGWILISDGGLRGEIAATNSTVPIGGIGAGIIANQSKYIRTPEDFGTGADAIQLAINACAAAGGGTVLLGPKTYTVTAPIEIKRKVNIIGNSVESTIISKQVASTVDGIDAVFIARDSELANNFRLENFKVLGNRTNKASGNTVSTNGIFLNFAHFYMIKNVMVENCLRGFVLNQNYVASLERITGLMCQDYGFHSYNSCTTLTVSNSLMWGCKGGYKVHSTIYSSFRDCACDHSDAGGTLTDPFLPQGSGGNYLDPAFLWDIVASRITVIGSGTENSYSQWLYAEGAFVDFINPYVFNMKGYSSTYRAIATRGTGKSRVNIRNPRFDIALDGAPSALRRMFFVENPRVQNICMDTPVSGGASFGEFAHPMKGVIFDDYIRILNYTQENMIVGQTQNNLIYTAADVEPTVTISGNVKRFNIINKTGSSKKMKVPIDNAGVIELILVGTHLSGTDTLTVRIVGDDGTLDVLKSFSLSGPIDLRTYIYLNEQTALTTKPIFLEILSPSSADTTFFTTFEVNRVM